MDVQVDVQKILELTQARLQAATQENILLHVVVASQQEEITKLKETLDTFADNKEGKEDGSSKE
jgi:hypothetical protein